MNLNEAQNRVADFMVSGGQLDERPDSYQIPADEIMARRLRLLREELDELDDAHGRAHIVDMADAYADLLYVLLGGAEEAGFDIEPVFAAVAEANDKKIDWDADEPRPFVTREDGKILKPEGWVGPEPQIAYLLGLES